MPTDPIVLEIPIQVVILGAQNTGKTVLREQLLQSELLPQIFDAGYTSDSDISHCIISPNMAHDEKIKQGYYPNFNSSNKSKQTSSKEPTTDSSTAQQEKEEGDNNNNEPKLRILPHLDSIGTSHSAQEFELTEEQTDSSNSQQLKIIFVFEIFEVSGATCCGNFQSKEMMELNCKNNADLILAVYDLCDRTSLLSLISDILPVAANAVKEQDVPIFVTGTKIDARKTLTSEERKNAVVAADQKELDAKLKMHLKNGIGGGAVLSSVAAGGEGEGVMRLRREIFLEVFKRRKTLFEKLHLAPLKTNLWNVLQQGGKKNLMRVLDDSVGKELQQSLAKNPTSRGGTATVSAAPPKTDSPMISPRRGGGGEFSPKAGDEEDKIEPPVLEATKSSRGGEGTKDGEKGSGCGLCGCACQ